MAAAAPSLAAVTALAVSLLLLSPRCRMVEAHFPAMYVFGDSMFDVGNNNNLSGGPFNLKANFPHYGIDYPGGTPTGRFSNGLIAVDFLAQRSEWDESVPAALKVQQNESQELRGLNFASGGSGILDTTNPNVSLSLSQQVTLFDLAVQRLVARNGSGAARILLNRTLFVVSTGTNDIYAFSKRGGLNASETDKAGFISTLVAELGSQLGRIYNLGARRFAVFGTGYLGCTAAVRAVNTAGGGDCVEGLNDLSQRYNAALREKLSNLSASYGEIHYSYVDVFNISTVVSMEPLKFGFKNITGACCGSGAFNGATACLPNATYCASRDEYAYWDWFHFTQAGHKLIADTAYNGTDPGFTEPFNIRTLVHL